MKKDQRRESHLGKLNKGQRAEPRKEFEGKMNLLGCLDPKSSNLLSKASTSELTVYKNAVENQINKRISSSSEEEEGLEIDVNLDQDKSNEEMGEITGVVMNDQLINQFITDVRERYSRGENHMDREDQPQLGTSRGQPRWNDMPRDKQYVESKSRKIIHDAEMSKARIHKVEGTSFNNLPFKLDLTKDFVHSAMVDETYQLVAAHVDEITQEKIINGDYVDFGHLVPKDRILMAEDNRYEMIVKEGKTYWVPAGAQESSTISNYNRW